MKLAKDEAVASTEELFARLLPRLRVIAHTVYRVNPTVDAEDLLQVGALAVLRLVRQDGLHRHARSYLLQAAENYMRNAMYGEFRQRMLTPVAVEELAAAGVHLPSDSQPFSGIEVRSTLARHKPQRLTGQQQSVLELRYSYGMKLREAGREMGGLSAAHVGEIDRALLRKYRRKFLAAGVHSASDVV